MISRPESEGRLPVFIVCLVCVTLSASVSGSTEAVLSWDDGEVDAYCGSPDAVRLAVWFQAPEWATSVVAVHVWFGGDMSPPCTVWLLRAAGAWPYEPGPPVNDGLAVAPVPTGGWLVLPIPDFVDITNAGLFPERVFFACIELETQAPEAVGVDTDYPIYENSLLFNWTSWAPYQTGDLMIRAVVSDSTGSVAEVMSWGVLKHAYGGAVPPE